MSGKSSPIEMAVIRRTAEDPEQCHSSTESDSACSTLGNLRL